MDLPQLKAAIEHAVETLDGFVIRKAALEFEKRLQWRALENGQAFEYKMKRGDKKREARRPLGEFRRPEGLGGATRWHDSAPPEGEAAELANVDEMDVDEEMGSGLQSVSLAFSER